MPRSGGVAGQGDPRLRGCSPGPAGGTISGVAAVNGIAKGVTSADSETVFDELADRLSRFVPFDGSLFFATDPATVLAIRPARIDGVANNQCFSYWEREFLVEDVNLFRDLARAPRPAATLWSATEGLPARSARYREFLRPEGWGDELRVAFRVGGSTWGIASLMRGAFRPPFSPDEIALVDALSAPVGAALRRATLDRPPALLQPPKAPGLMLFDPDGELLSISEEARGWLGELPQPPIGPRPLGSPLPTEVVGVVARARAIAHGAVERSCPGTAALVQRPLARPARQLLARPRRRAPGPSPSSSSPRTARRSLPSSSRPTPCPPANRRSPG